MAENGHTGYGITFSEEEINEIIIITTPTLQ